MRRVTLYGAEGCHLCVVAKHKIERVRRFVPLDVQLVDIRQDPALMARYGTTIPVVAIDGQDRLVSKVTEFGLIRALLGSALPTLPARSAGGAGAAALDPVSHER